MFSGDLLSHIVTLSHTLSHTSQYIVTHCHNTLSLMIMYIEQLIHCVWQSVVTHCHIVTYIVTQITIHCHTLSQYIVTLSHRSQSTSTHSADQQTTMLSGLNIVYSSSQKTHRSVTCHTGSHSVTWHLTQVNVPHLSPSQTADSNQTKNWTHDRLITSPMWITDAAKELVQHDLYLMDIVARRRARLVDGWETVCGQVNHLSM